MELENWDGIGKVGIEKVDDRKSKEKIGKVDNSKFKAGNGKTKAIIGK